MIAVDGEARPAELVAESRTGQSKTMSIGTRSAAIAAMIAAGRT
jgi:hypothetical protein